jgi:NADH dehydrogenase
MREARGGTLIVGGGFAGATLARMLGPRGATIVSRHNFMLYTPLLPEAASGTLEPRHVVVPLRVMCPHAELVLGTAVHLDRDRQIVAADSHAGRIEIRYENCVVALGAEPRVLPIPGLREYAVGFNSLADAIHLRNHVLGELEAADAAAGEDDVERHLTFVFVGGGYAGVEALAELSDLVHDACRYYPRLRSRPKRWVLVEAAPAILAQISEQLGAYAHRELVSRDIEIRTSTQLLRVEADGVELGDGTWIPTHTVVWTAGVRPSRAFAAWGLPLDERARIRVTESLRVEGCDGLWALGDCARVPNSASGGEPDPPTCQHALRQARRLAKNVRGNEQPYRYRMLGQAATLGRYKGIMDFGGGRVRLRGFVGWFATRTYHLYQMPLWSRKLRVVVDWTTSLLFRRDIVELGTLGHPDSLGQGGDGSPDE